MTELKFKNYLVAYVDVLGFKNQIMKLKSKRNEQKVFLQNYLVDATDKARAITKIKQGSDIDLEIKVISDTFFFSIPCEKRELVNSLAHISAAVGFLQSYLSSLGMWTRGAITFGELIRNEGNVVGPALIDSYLLESNDAIYPRVILDPRIVKNFENCKDLVDKVNGLKFNNWRGTRLFYLDNHLPLADTKFNDDLIFVDYFNAFLTDPDPYELFRKTLEHLKNDFYEKPDVYKKHKWTQRYFQFKQCRTFNGAEDSFGIVYEDKLLTSRFSEDLDLI